MTLWKEGLIIATKKVFLACTAKKHLPPFYAKTLVQSWWSHMYSVISPIFSSLQENTGWPSSPRQVKEDNGSKDLPLQVWQDVPDMAAVSWLSSKSWVKLGKWCCSVFLTEKLKNFLKNLPKCQFQSDFSDLWLILKVFESWFVTWHKTRSMVENDHSIFGLKVR